MRKINYELVVSDFDGTLAHSDGGIGEYSKTAIQEYIKNGGKFVVSTGRMPRGIFHKVKELGLTGAVSCYQGSAIMDIESEQPLFEGTMDNATAVKVCRKIETFGLHMHVYTLHDFYVNKADEGLKHYEKMVGVKGILTEELSAFVEREQIRPYKILAMVPVEIQNEVYQTFYKEFGEKCYVTNSGASLVEVCNKTYSKGTAMEFLSNYYGVPLEKTLAIGDQQNDVPMLERAGLGIAVKNAQNSLKEKADVVSEYTNNEDAVGRIVEKYGYTEE